MRHAADHITAARKTALETTTLPNEEIAGFITREEWCTIFGPRRAMRWVRELMRSLDWSLRWRTTLERVWECVDPDQHLCMSHEELWNRLSVIAPPGFLEKKAFVASWRQFIRLATGAGTEMSDSSTTQSGSVRGAMALVPVGRDGQTLLTRNDFICTGFAAVQEAPLVMLFRSLSLRRDDQLLCRRIFAQCDPCDAGCVTWTQIRQQMLRLRVYEAQPAVPVPAHSTVGGSNDAAELGESERSEFMFVAPVWLREAFKEACGTSLFDEGVTLAQWEEGLLSLYVRAHGELMMWLRRIDMNHKRLQRIQQLYQEIDTHRRGFIYVHELMSFIGRHGPAGWLKRWQMQGTFGRVLNITVGAHAKERIPVWQFESLVSCSEDWLAQLIHCAERSVSIQQLADQVFRICDPMLSGTTSVDTMRDVFARFSQEIMEDPEQFNSLSSRVFGQRRSLPYHVYLKQLLPHLTDNTVYDAFVAVAHRAHWYNTLGRVFDAADEFGQTILRWGRIEHVLRTLGPTNFDHWLEEATLPSLFEWLDALRDGAVPGALIDREDWIEGQLKMSMNLVLRELYGSVVASLKLQNVAHIVANECDPQHTGIITLKQIRSLSDAVMNDKLRSMNMLPSPSAFKRTLRTVFELSSDPQVMGSLVSALEVQAISQDATALRTEALDAASATSNPRIPTRLWTAIICAKPDVVSSLSEDLTWEDLRGLQTFVTQLAEGVQFRRRARQVFESIDQTGAGFVSLANFELGLRAIAPAAAWNCGSGVVYALRASPEAAYGVVSQDIWISCCLQFREDFNCVQLLDTGCFRAARLAMVRDMFNSLDESNAGEVPLTQLKASFDSLAPVSWYGGIPNPKDPDSCMFDVRVDMEWLDGVTKELSGVVTASEWERKLIHREQTGLWPFLEAVSRRMRWEKDLGELFGRMDVDDSFGISRAELHHFVATCGPRSWLSLRDFDEHFRPLWGASATAADVSQRLVPKSDWLKACWAWVNESWFRDFLTASLRNIRFYSQCDAVFDYLDRDNSGVLERDEFMDAVQDYGPVDIQKVVHVDGILKCVAATAEVHHLPGATDVPSLVPKQLTRAQWLRMCHAGRSNPLWQWLLTCMLSTVEWMQALNYVFASIDVDASKVLTMNELLDAIDTLAPPRWLSHHEVARVFSCFQEDEHKPVVHLRAWRGALIDRYNDQEVRHVIHIMQKRSQWRDALSAVFRVLDPLNLGFVSFKTLESRGFPANALRAADLDQNGDLSIQEFVNFYSHANSDQLIYRLVHRELGIVRRRQELELAWDMFSRVRREWAGSDMISATRGDTLSFEHFSETIRSFGPALWLRHANAWRIVLDSVYPAEDSQHCLLPREAWLNGAMPGRFACLPDFVELLASLASRASWMQLLDRMWIEMDPHQTGTVRIADFMVLIQLRGPPRWLQSFDFHSAFSMLAHIQIPKGEGTLTQSEWTAVLGGDGLRLRWLVDLLCSMHRATDWRLKLERLFDVVDDEGTGRITLRQWNDACKYVHCLQPHWVMLEILFTTCRTPCIYWRLTLWLS